MTEQHGLPQELPPAYVPPAYIAPASALDQPALGLVLVFAALMALPQAATMLSQMLALDGSPEWSFVALTGLMCGSAALQLVAGIAIAWQRWWKQLAFAAYVACGLVLVVCAFALWRHELGSEQAGAIALETLGGPVVVLVAPRLFGVTRIAHGEALGGLLVLGGVSTLLFQPVYVYGYGRILWDEHISVGSLLGAAVSPLIGVGLAGLQVWTGVRMARGQPARRWLLAYVIAALVGHAGLDLVSIVYWLFDGAALHMKVLLVHQVIGLVLAVAQPAIVWQFAKREPEPAPFGRVGSALPWVALWFVPQLAARCLLHDELDALMGGLPTAILVLCGAQALVCLVAARAWLRDEGRVLAWLLGAVIAAVMLGLVMYWVLVIAQGDASSVSRARIFGLLAQAVPPVALLFATMATGTWLARRVTSS